MNITKRLTEEELNAAWLKHRDEFVNELAAFAINDADGGPTTVEEWLDELKELRQWDPSEAADSGELGAQFIGWYIGRYGLAREGASRADYWLAVAEGEVVGGMDTDDGNDGAAARQEMNDWINERMMENPEAPAIHLVGVKILSEEVCGG